MSVSTADDRAPMVPVIYLVILRNHYYSEKQDIQLREATVTA